MIDLDGMNSEWALARCLNFNVEGVAVFKNMLLYTLQDLKYYKKQLFIAFVSDFSEEIDHISLTLGIQQEMCVPV